MPPKEKIKRIKDEALASPVAVIEPAANGGGKKRYSSPACESLVEKKPKTSSVTRGSSSVAKKLVIDLTFLEGAKKTVKPKPMKPAAPKCMLGTKSGLTSKRLAAMKSRKVNSADKVAPKHVHSSAMTDSFAENGKSAHIGSCERSTKFEVREFLEVCALLKADLLEDVDACAKFVDSVGKVVIRSDSFAKRPAYSRRSSLSATMHKTLILEAKSIRVDQDAIKCAKEAEVALVAQLRSAVENTEKLISALVVLKGYNVSAPTFLQLEIAHQELPI
ncbi:hypothetical protein ACFX10_029648 [Malus domestica]